MRLRLFAGIVFMFATLLAAPAAAQQASIVGTATDETRAVLPGVAVTAVELSTGAQFMSVTDERGEYRLLQMAPGRYKVQAELSGFGTVLVPEIQLLVGQSAAVPLVLKLAQVTETLTVTGEAPLVDTNSSQVAGNVNPRQMEELPLQGRNWMELSKMVKGVTANVINNNPGVSDDMFQLNLDGQQVTQKISGGFGQPRFSRESIAEFQIVTNMFDITQGRSAGMQVQAVSRSGTNRTQGSLYGFFRDDALNAPDAVTKTVLPYQNQQIGGSLGGPIVRDKAHFFASYEYEREPGTNFSAPSALPGQSFTTPYRNSQKSLLARVDQQLSTKNRLTARGTRWDWANPFVLAASGHPSNASSQTKSATNIVGTWSSVLSDTRVQQLQVGYNNFQWANQGLEQVGNTFEYNFPGLTLGKPYNYPQWLYQHYTESRYDLNWHRKTHDYKIGGEFIFAHVNALWYLQREGRLSFTSLPADISSRIPQSDPYNIAAWNLAGLDPLAQRLEKNYNNNDWILSVPGPTWALWFGDNWRLNQQLTVNYGVRWDNAWNAASTPDTIPNSILIANGSPAASTRIPGMEPGDFGYRNDIRDNLDIAPRAGFAWNVGGSNDLVIRGGSGLYFALPQTQYTYSPQLYSRMITASFPNDGRPGFIQDPTRGVSTYEQALAAAPAQTARIFSPDFRNAYTWQSSLGVQKQLNSVTGFEADVVHYNMYRDLRTIDPNLVFDPANGYNRNPATIRPNPAYGQIVYFVGTGQQDYTAVSTALNRRLKAHFQGGITYTLVVSQHDDGGASLTNPSANNQFNYLDGESATSTAFQRNTLRAWALYQLPWGLSTSLSYSYGSGTRYNDSIAVAVYGKPGTNRLNLTATGGASPAIAIPAAVLDRWLGAATIASGEVIPRNALEGTPYSRLDLRLTKEFKVGGSLRASVIGEIYNLFNHANYTQFSTTLSATNAATTARFGQPTAADIARQGQLAFRIAF
jgi:carboxypeptidase family protein